MTTSDDWNVVTLREHILALLEDKDRHYAKQMVDLEKSLENSVKAQREVVSAALAAADRAVQKAETAAEKRFESVNEFRNTLADQQRNLIPRSEVVVMVQALSEKVNTLKEQIDHLQSERMGIKGGWGYAVGALGFFVAIASLLTLLVRLSMTP